MTDKYKYFKIEITDHSKLNGKYYFREKNEETAINRFKAINGAEVFYDPLSKRHEFSFEFDAEIFVIELDRVYTWDEDGTCSVADWRYAVANDDTRLGYWDWVWSQKEQLYEDAQNGLIGD